MYFKEEYDDYKEDQQKRYGYYCSLTRIKGEIPMPYHKWQEIDEKREYIIGIDLAKDATKKFVQEYDCEWIGEENMLENAKFSEQDLKDLNG